MASVWLKPLKRPSNINNYLRAVCFQIEAKELLFLTRWSLLICVLQIIAFIGNELFLLLCNCSEDWDKYLLNSYFTFFFFFSGWYLITYFFSIKFKQKSLNIPADVFKNLLKYDDQCKFGDLLKDLLAALAFSIPFFLLYPNIATYYAAKEFPIKVAYHVSTTVFILCQLVCFRFGTLEAILHSPIQLLISLLVYFTVLDCHPKCTIDEEYVYPDMQDFDEHDETAEAGWVIVNSATM